MKFSIQFILKYFFSLSFLFISCAPIASTKPPLGTNSIPTNNPPKAQTWNKNKTDVTIQSSQKLPAEAFFDVHNLGKMITKQSGFSELFLNYISDERKKQGIYLARVDDFTLGTPLTGLSTWDLALEVGLIDGLNEKGLSIVEKLDHIKPRDVSEYIGTSPSDGFYMHGINLNDLKLIRSELKAPNLLTYQIIDFNDKELTVNIYLRLIDLRSMKIISSSMIGIGNMEVLDVEEEIEHFTNAYEIIKNVSDFPKVIFSKDVNVSILNSDILNISGNYKNPPSTEIVAIENGIISGLIHHDSYKNNSPVLLEKTSGFKLKFPDVYNSIVFNTSPILYEEWEEFVTATKSDFLIMYRYLPNNGMYIKIIDTNANGKILYSKGFNFNGREDEGIIENHNIVSSSFKKNIDFRKLKNKKIMILSGDKQAVDSEKYFQTQPNYNEMNLSIEEGIISALVQADIRVYEKLKTLYLKRPWMYSDKVFNLNPLYLDEWNQLKSFGVETLIVYNNLIPYEELTSSSPNYKKVALGIRIIDVNTGYILDVNEISNLN